MVPQFQIRSKGEFLFEVRDAEGSTVKRSIIPDSNMLLDGFFTNVGTVLNPLQYGVIRCGSGSTARTTSMSALSNQLTLQSGTWPLSVVTHPTVAYDATTNSYRAISTFVSTFAVGQIVGNVSEWGIEFNNIQTANRTVMHASALVTDGNGNPTTVQVLASEQLIVTYRLVTQLTAADYVASTVVTIDGVQQSTAVTGRWGTLKTADAYYGLAAAPTFTARGGPLNAATTALGGSSLGTKTSTFVTVNGKKVYRCSLLVGDWNIGGIGFIDINSGMLKYEFSPPLPKAAGQTCVIDVTVDYGRL